MPRFFVAYGVTGDLMRLKILPALYELHALGALPEEFSIIGVSRKPWDTEQLRDYVRSIGLHDESFVSRVSFLQGDASEATLYTTLAHNIQEERAVFYFSLSPALYESVFAILTMSPLSHANLRLMIEKPFGTSGPQAQTLLNTLTRVYTEEQLYLVDHYLAKEALLSLAPPQKNLVAVDAYFLETDGVEKRGVSYDAMGALRDVGQNHLLEMVASVLPGDRVSALRSLQPRPQAIRAQYDGYLTIPGVLPHSTTETYFEAQLNYGEIPVRLVGGKRMPHNRKEIMLTYEDGSVSIPIGQNTGRSEYACLVQDCLEEKKERFVSLTEMQLLWQIIDPIVLHWKLHNDTLLHYTPHTLPKAGA